MDVSQLSWATFQDLVSSAAKGGWSGLLSLALAVLVAAALVWRTFVNKEKVAAAENDQKRIDRQAANAAENQAAEVAQAKAEQEIEQILKEK